MSKVTLAEWRPTARQKQLVNKVVESGRLTYGPMTKEFEKKFAKLHGKKYAIFMNSGTSALSIALGYMKQKYGWEDGDEVIVPSVTFVATINVILHNGLTPVLVDVNPKTFNIDPNLIEDQLTGRTRAIMPVDLLGQPCEIDKIRRIANKFNPRLQIIEDSCETMFVKYKGKPVGSQADIACYSSYLAHIISTGVGGFVTTDDLKAERYMRSMIWHGRDDRYLNIDDYSKIAPEDIAKVTFRFDKVGFSYRLTELEAALGIDELIRYRQIIQKRKAIAGYMTKLLSPFEEYIQLPTIAKGSDNAWMFYPIVVKNGDRDKLSGFLNKAGVQTRFIMPLTNQPVYHWWLREKDYPVAKKINEKGLLLGCHHFLTRKDVEYVARCMKEFFYD